MTECIFCKIVKKEIPADIIYEDDKVLAFLDIRPVNPGHALIIPKEHHSYIVDTPDEIVAYVFITAKKLMSKIKSALNAKFTALSVVGMDVPHFHVHIIPRFDKDGLANFWPTKVSKKEELSIIAQKIREFNSGK